MFKFRKTEDNMGFWDLKTLKLDEFRPGIWSKLESGTNLTMAFMEIAPNKEGSAHDHPFDQCGVVLEGEIEMSIQEKNKLGGRWKPTSFQQARGPVKIFVSAKEMG
jgi:mannose-6-phosphate isomerase-like protein (cupin superfamily)